MFECVVESVAGRDSLGSSRRDVLFSSGLLARRALLGVAVLVAVQPSAWSQSVNSIPAVSSVNRKTGAVTLSASDVGAVTRATTELNAADYGAGSSTCGIQEALNALPNGAATGGTVHVHGFCNYSTPITVTGSPSGPSFITIAGDGPNATFLNYLGGGSAIVVGSTSHDTKGVTIRDLGLGVNANAVNGIYAYRTKHFTVEHVFGNSGGHTGGSFVTSDGSSTSGTFSSYGFYAQNQCNFGWRRCFDMKGSGVNEASNNNNTFLGNEVLYYGNETDAIAYDFETGGGNYVAGGDIDGGWPIAYHVVGRNNFLAGMTEASGIAAYFDNSLYGSSEGNILQGFLAGQAIKDTGTGNAVLDPSQPVKFGSYSETLTTPRSSSAACTPGQFTDDANFHYVCTGINTWKRVALSSF